MKRILKAISLIALLAMLIAIVLPACKPGGSGGTPDTSEFYEEGSYDLPIAAADRKLTLSFMGRDSEQAGTSFNSHRALTWEKIEEETGIDIEWQVIPNEDYQNQSGIRMADVNDLPDIMCVVGSSDGSQLIKLFQDGILLDMKPYIDKYAPNLKKFLDDNPDVAKGLTLPGGEIVAFGGMNLSRYSAATTLIRKDWLDKFNLGIPSNPDELYNAVYKFVKEDANGNGEADEMGIMGADYSTARQIGTGWGLTLITGSGWFKKDGEVVCQWTSDAYKDFIKWLKKCYDNGLLDKDFDHSWDTKPEDTKFNSNQLGVLSRGWTSQIISHNDPTNTLKAEHPEAFWVPVLWKDTQYGIAVPKENASALWRTFGISKTCKDPIAAVRLFDYMICGNGRNYEMYGLEGVNYNLVDGVRVGIPNYTEKLEAGTFLGAGYFCGYSTEDDFLYSLNNTQYLKDDPDLMAEIKGYLEDAAGNTVEPFQPPIPSVEDGQRVGELLNDFLTYREEAYAKFIKGELDIDADWDDYVAKMNELGATEIKEIYSK